MDLHRNICVLMVQTFGWTDENGTKIEEEESRKGVVEW
jgi:hypothetical protein